MKFPLRSNDLFDASSNINAINCGTRVRLVCGIC